MNVLSSVFQYLFNKFTLKFIALLMAIFLWSFVKSKNQIEITRKINVLISEPSGFVTPAGTSYQKEVHLSGPKTLINQVNAKTLVARVHPSPDKAQIFETTGNMAVD